MRAIILRRGGVLMGQDWSQRVRRVAAAAEELRRGFFADSTPALIAACEVVAASLRRGGRLYLFGNGGSAADAQHIAAEFVNRLDRERPALAALALTTDSSALTSIANDRAYDQVFSRQLEAFAASGDVALGISTSGNSPSVLSALSLARERCLVTLGLLGGDGGKALALCDHPLVVPSRSTQRIQELHIMLGHLLAELVEEMLEQPEGAR